MITMKTIEPYNTGTEVMVGELLSHRIDGLINFLIDCRHNGVVFLEFEEDTNGPVETVWATAYFNNSPAAHLIFYNTEDSRVEQLSSAKLWSVRAHF